MNIGIKMNNKKIIVIGDSHTAFAHGDVEKLIIDDFKIIDSGIRKVLNLDISFFWEHGKPAYAVKRDFLYQITNENNIKDSIIIFWYGCNDICRYIHKYQNEKDVVKQYIFECVQFCKENNCDSIFVYPISQLLFEKQANIFNNALKDECLKQGINEPIKILDNIITKKYITEDAYVHLSKNDSDKAIEYIVSKTIERINFL